jgi:hypothetical protein
MMRGELDLGLMASTDEGRTWTSVSQFGTADLHLLRMLGD